MRAFPVKVGETLVSAHRAKAINLNVVVRVGLPYTLNATKEEDSLGQNYDVMNLAVFDNYGVYTCVSKDQLWRLKVASNDPDLGAEKGEDEGEPVAIRPRQLGGLNVKKTQTSESGSCKRRIERGWLRS